MIKSPEIKVNPNVLKTLREGSGYTVEEIAKKIKTTVTKVQEAEKGVALFTLAQIKKLALFTIFILLLRKMLLTK